MAIPWYLKIKRFALSENLVSDGVGYLKKEDINNQDNFLFDTTGQIY